MGARSLPCPALFLDCWLASFDSICAVLSRLHCYLKSSAPYVICAAPLRSRPCWHIWPNGGREQRTRIRFEAEGKKCPKVLGFTLQQTTDGKTISYWYYPPQDLMSHCGATSNAHILAPEHEPDSGTPSNYSTPDGDVQSAPSSLITRGVNPDPQIFSQLKSRYSTNTLLSHVFRCRNASSTPECFP